MSKSFLRIVRMPWDHTISPFHDPISQVPVFNTPLSTMQENIAARCGLELVDAVPGEAIQGPCIVIRGDLFFAFETLQTFLKEATQGDTNRAKIIAIPQESTYGRQTAPMQENVVRDTDEGPVWVFGMVAVFDKTPWTDAASWFAQMFEEAQPVCIDLNEKVHVVDVPEHYFGRDTLELPVTMRPVMHMRHWVHIMQANQASIVLHWLEQGKLRLALRAIWGAIRALSVNKYRVLGKINTIGSGCDIHPTALIEGSVLGKGCRIGPYARVRFSVLGDNVAVQGGAQVEFCVLGERSMVSQNSWVHYCVSHEQAAFGGVGVQLCVFGRKSIMVLFGMMMDTNFSRDVHVKMGDRIYDSGQRFLGCALGHRAKLGSGVNIAAGREVPNGSVLVLDPKGVMAKFPADVEEGEVLIVRDGVVRPL